MDKTNFRSVDEYIKTFPKEVQSILEKMRQTVKKAAPSVVEAISYQMPTFKLNGKALVYFAAFKSHIGFYPIPSGVEAFKKELSPYKKGKGSVQFPMDQPMPYDLVKRIVRFRAKQLLKKRHEPSAFRTDTGLPGNRAYGRRCYGSRSELAEDGRRKKGLAALADAMTNAGSLGLRSTAGRNT